MQCPARMELPPVQLGPFSSHTMFCMRRADHKGDHAFYGYSDMTEANREMDEDFAALRQEPTEAE